MKRHDLYWPAMVFMAVFLFAFGFAVTVSAGGNPPGVEDCCFEMCPGSLTDTSHYGYVDDLTGECICGFNPDKPCDYRAFLCSEY